MLKFWNRFWSILNATGVLITLATGIPVVVTAAAARWAYFDQVPGLGIFLISLFTLMTALWTTIGMGIALRTRENRRIAPDCSWDLIVDSYFLVRDLSWKEHDWRVEAVLRNKNEWLIRITVEEFRVSLENILPERFDMKGLFPQVIAGKEALALHSMAYQKGVLPDKDVLSGTVDLKVSYGHPDYGNSRTMIRRVNFNVTMKPPIPTIPGFEILLQPNKIAVAGGPREEDKDYPYVPPLL